MLTSHNHDHTHYSQTQDRGQTRIARCVDCRRPLFTKTWKERIKGHLDKARFIWPSKKKQDNVMQVGRYTVKQRCAECHEPLRCGECSEAFFGNLSANEIKVFIKAMVLFAMKGLCVDCNKDFKFVYQELFEADSCETPGAGLDRPGKLSTIELDGVIAKAKGLCEVQPLDELSGGRKRGSTDDVMDWKGGVFLGDWKKEMNDVLCNRFHLVLER